MTTSDSNIYIPKPYHEDGIRFIMGRRKCGLHWPPGVGKTGATLMAVYQLVMSVTVTRVLVVAPKRVALRSWPDEIHKWQQFQALDYAVLRGSADERRALYRRNTATIHIIQFDFFKELVKFWRSRKQWPYDMLIIDESTKVKSPSSKNFQACKAVAKFCDFVVELTGTPAPNGYLDLWTQTYLLDYGATLLRTFGEFKQEYYVSDYKRYKWTPREGSEARIRQKISKFYHSVDVRQVLDLQRPLDPHNIWVTLPDSVQELYDRMETEMYIELQQVGIEAVNAGVVSMKCRQIANGFIYDEDRAEHVLHEEKLDALEDLIESLSGEPLLLGYQFGADWTAIKKRMKDRVTLFTDDPQIQTDWNDGRIPLLVVQPDGVAHGLNLQFGGFHTAWFGPTWNLENYLQFNERLGDVRQFQAGLNRQSIVHRILATGTVDEAMVSRIVTKQSAQDALLQYLQAKHARA